MVKTDKSNFLTAIKSPDKLELTEIRKDLPLFVRNRRFREMHPEGNTQPNSPTSPTKMNYPPDIARIAYLPKDGKHSTVQIVGEKELFRIFTIRK